MVERMPFAGRCAVLATMHGKESAIAEPMQDILGLKLCIPSEIDTDQLGTFTQDIPRPGTMDEVLKRKAKLGMELTGLDLGLASEGSYGPHPHAPFIPLGLEKMIFVDQMTGLCCTEQIFDHTPSYCSWEIRSVEDLSGLTSAFVSLGFPEQALIVRTQPQQSGRIIEKGIRDLDQLAHNVRSILQSAQDSVVLVETDMRAHMNPSRMRTISNLAKALASRLATPCPVCGSPGWGRIGIESGLPCSWCAQPTALASAEILGCPTCSHSEKQALHEDMHFADPGLCQNCNP